VSSDEPSPDLTLTGTGGGRTKWIAAVVALAVLGGVIYVGISGPSAKAPANSPNPAVAVGPTVPSSPLPTATPFPNDEVVSIRTDPTAPVLYQYLGTGLVMNGRGTLAILDPVGPDHYQGVYRIPYPELADSASLELDAVTASVSNDDLDHLGHWTFPILSVGHGAGSPVIALDSNGGQTNQTLTNPDFSRLATNGFHLTATIQGQADAALMTIDVTINADQYFPQEHYSLTAGSGRQLFGFELENFGPGGYDGQALVPSNVLGKTISVTISAVPLSDLTSSPLAVGTWSLYIPRSQKDLSNPYGAHIALNDQGDGSPVANYQSQILVNGFYMSLGTAVQDGQTSLSVGLNARPSKTPLPTR
jgi:hypothetical protein